MERTAEPVLALLDVLGVSRLDTYSVLVSSGRERMTQLIPSLPANRLRDLALACFVHVDRPELRPVVLAVLEHVPEVPDELIASLVDDRRGILDSMPLRVKQGVWERDHSAFRTETFPMIIERMSLEVAAELPGIMSDAPADPVRRRKHSKSVNQLLELLGSARLYRVLVALLREIFENTASELERGLVAMLRCDMLMALHEADEPARPAARWDPEHRFVCCLDAAAHQHSLDAPLLRALLARLHKAGLPPLPPPSTEPPLLPLAHGADTTRLGDLALTLTPPTVLSLVTAAALRRLYVVAQEQRLPAADAELATLLQLLSLAFIAQPLSKDPKLNPERWVASSTALMLRLAPPIVELLVDDRIRELCRRDETTADSGPPLAPPPLPPGLVALRREPYAAPAQRVFLLYVLGRLEAGDSGRAEQLLPLARDMLLHEDGGCEQGLLARYRALGWAGGAGKKGKEGEEGRRPESCESVRAWAGTLPELRVSFARGVGDVLLARPEALTEALADALLTQLLLPLSGHESAAHLELARLLEGLCAPQLLAKLGAGATTLARIAQQAREGGATGDHDSLLGAAHDRIARLLQRA